MNSGTGQHGAGQAVLEPEELSREAFDELAQAWRADTRFHSALSKKFTHPAYVTIIGAGRSALPFILEELARQADHWFYALRYIARRDVAEGAESMEEARGRWLEWGRKNGYLR